MQCLLILSFIHSGDVKLSTSSHISIDHIHGTLAIKSTQYIDAGEYTCEARNEAGKSGGKVTITVGGKVLFCLLL